MFETMSHLINTPSNRYTVYIFYVHVFHDIEHIPNFLNRFIVYKLRNNHSMRPENHKPHKSCNDYSFCINMVIHSRYMHNLITRLLWFPLIMTHQRASERHTVNHHHHYRSVRSFTQALELRPRCSHVSGDLISALCRTAVPPCNWVINTNQSAIFALFRIRIGQPAGNAEHGASKLCACEICRRRFVQIAFATLIHILYTTICYVSAHLCRCERTRSVSLSPIRPLPHAA